MTIKLPACDGRSLLPVLSVDLLAVILPAVAPDINCGNMHEAFLALANVVDSFVAIPNAIVTSAVVRTHVGTMLARCEAVMCEQS